MNNEATAITLAHRILGGFNSGDVASIADCFHREVSAEFPFAPPGMPASCSGHDAVMAAFRDGRASIAEITITPTKFYWCPHDSLLVIEANGRGRLMHGTKYENAYVFLVGIHDGRVSLWREYFNSLIIQRALEAEAAAAG
jgi:ketosteroid isomerase-like protein